MQGRVLPVPMAGDAPPNWFSHQNRDVVGTHSRPSSRPSFWDTRYADHEKLFGREPSSFVSNEAHRIPVGSEVVELGAGEGRTLLWLAQERATDGTAVDFSSEALTTAEQWAQHHNVSLHTVQADVRKWVPDRQWDVVVVTFLQLLPAERSSLYRTIRSCLRPGGLVMGEWFRPAHLKGGYDRVGPSSSDRMVSEDEIRAAFSADDILRCAAVDVELDEGPFLNGMAAVVRLLARRQKDDDSVEEH